MCRLLGIVAVNESPEPGSLLAARESLTSLPHGRPSGWGVAVHHDAGWIVERFSRGVGETFGSIAPRLRGPVLLAHVRAQTIGSVSIASTQPLKRGRWVLAQNGTLENLEYLRRSISNERLRECEGDTDGELLFAFLLTRLGKGENDRAFCDVAISEAAHDLMRYRVGTTNFLLSDGEVLYAHRLGKPLCIIERAGALLFASEPSTEERWLPLERGAVVRCERTETRLNAVFLRGLDPRRDRRVREMELPFTD